MLENGRCTGVRLQSGEALRAGAVLVATGGVSYPVTGSTGDGYRFARQAGHTVMPPEPEPCFPGGARRGVQAYDGSFP